MFGTYYTVLSFGSWISTPPPITFNSMRHCFCFINIKVMPFRKLEAFLTLYPLAPKFYIPSPTSSEMFLLPHFSFDCDCSVLGLLLPLLEQAPHGSFFLHSLLLIYLPCCHKWYLTKREMWLLSLPTSFSSGTFPVPWTHQDFLFSIPGCLVPLIESVSLWMAGSDATFPTILRQK